MFLKTIMIYPNKFTLLQNSVYPLSFDSSYKMAEHEPFQMVMSTLICAEYEVKGVAGSATFQNEGCVEIKDIH